MIAFCALRSTRESWICAISGLNPSVAARTSPLNVVPPVPVVYFGCSADGEGGGSLSLGDVVRIRAKHNEIYGGRGRAFACLTGVIYSLIRECHIQCLRLREHDGTVFGPPRNGNLRILHLLGLTGVAQGESVVDIPLLVLPTSRIPLFSEDCR